MSQMDHLVPDHRLSTATESTQYGWRFVLLLQLVFDELFELIYQELLPY